MILKKNNLSIYFFLAICFFISLQALAFDWNWDLDQKSKIFVNGEAYLYCQLECQDEDGWQGNTGKYLADLEGGKLQFTGEWLKMSSYTDRAYVVKDGLLVKVNDLCQEEKRSLLKQDKNIRTRISFDLLSEKECQVKSYATTKIGFKNYPIVPKSKMGQDKEL